MGKSATQESKSKPDENTMDWLKGNRQIAAGVAGSLLGPWATSWLGGRYAGERGPEGYRTYAPGTDPRGGYVGGLQNSAMQYFGNRGYTGGDPMGVQREGGPTRYNDPMTFVREGGPPSTDPGSVMREGGFPQLGSMVPDVNPLTGEAVDYTRGVMNMGAQGQGAYTQALGGLGQLAGGDASAFYNPFESQVVSATQADAERQRALAMKAADDVATREGAFGGSRHGIMAGQAIGDVNRNEMSTLAGLRYSGFNDARNFGLGANQALAGAGLGGAGMGFGASSQMGTYGDYMRQIEQEKAREPLNNALTGMQIMSGMIPGGGTTQSVTMPGNPMGAVLGLGGMALGIPGAGKWIGDQAFKLLGGNV